MNITSTKPDFNNQTLYSILVQVCDNEQEMNFLQNVIIKAQKEFASKMYFNIKNEMNEEYK